MKPKGSIRTSDNVFDFGRGGKANLSCSYTFTIDSGNGLKLTLRNSSFGDRPCRTVTDYETGRQICNYHIFAQRDENSTVDTTSPSPVKSELKIMEYIWPNLNVTSNTHCVCSNFSGNSGPTFTFLGRRVELLFIVEGMNGGDSFENFFVHFDYEVLTGKGCGGDNHYMRTESGLIALESTFSLGPKVPTCEQYPWLLEARENHSLYLRIPGYPMIEEKRYTGPTTAINSPPT